MSRSAREIAAALKNAQSNPVVPIGKGPRALAEAQADRKQTIRELTSQLQQRQSEEAGSWIGAV